jgi:hypothetical protein
MKVLIGCAAVLIAVAAVSAADAKGCLKGAAVGGVAGHYILATMGYWERRPVALSDVTKPTSVTACKETSSISLTAICEMERSASSAMPGPQIRAFLSQRLRFAIRE